MAFDDVVGELELSTYLSLGGPLGDDIASDWLGDRFVALQRGNEYAALWNIRFTDVTTSRRAEELATQVGRNTGGHLLATAHGHDLLIIRNVPDAVARSAAQEFVQTLNAGRVE